MLNKMLYAGEQIKMLIPQRDPIIMLDAFYRVTEDECRTGLTITSANIFCREDNFEVPGLIEHIAQSASAFMGYKALQKDLPASIGYIGEVKNFTLHKKAGVGDCLYTKIVIRTQVMQITLIEAETRVDEVLIATCRMKISMEE